VQEVDEPQDTALKVELVAGPSAQYVHRRPFQVSSRLPLASVPLAAHVPTATQRELDVHDTAVRLL
jgi:hypothetical protein